MTVACCGTIISDKQQKGVVMAKKTAKAIVISRPDMQTVTLGIRGTSPMVQNKFGTDALNKMMETQMEGSTAKKGKKRDPKDFDALYRAAMHVSIDEWHGIPAATFRNAMVSACRVCGFQMTKAKLSVFVEADGYAPDGTPLVRITHGEPHPFDAVVRNANGVADIRRRPMFDPGWEAIVRVTYDRGMFKPDDVYNLMMRVGMQVGIGEGRHDSKASTGMGWGSFELVEISSMIKVA